MTRAKPTHTAVILAAALLVLAGCSWPFSGDSKKPAGVNIADLTARADTGDVKAMFKLGESFEKNPRSASKWYCLAAKKGYEPAQYKLGQLYTGNLLSGVKRAINPFSRTPADKTAALLWLEVAIAHGSNDAIRDGLELRRQMSRDEIAQAMRRKRDWKAAPCTWAEVFGN